jgi:uncharacterized protein YegP (UPF0339 family)
MDKLEVFEAADGWHWHRKAAGNNEIIGQGEAYETEAGAVEGAERANPDLQVELS